ncbi:MAG: hypothetical protein CSA33_07050 [Desulfobulbus propionicus]|nr:MAG: hypothetical protein CSA33_07050 [Desulfobulbus propionicus]
MALAEALHQCSGEASRVFKDFCYATLATWRWQRRVIGKAEYLTKGENPRFVVTSFNKGQYDAQGLYEIMLATGYPHKHLWDQILTRLASLPLRG